METDLLTHEQTLNFISHCEIKGAFVFGIERFVVSGNNTIPDIDGIADFSGLSEQEVELSIELSKDFLGNYGLLENERFSVVF